MNKPIPRRLLPHSVTHYVRTGVDRNGKGIFGAGLAVTYVRVKPRKMVRNENLGEFNADQWEMDFDCVNSTPLGNIFKEGDEIEWNGKRYPIRRVELFYTVYSTPHHFLITIG
jgi:hypothetical protein